MQDLTLVIPAMHPMQTNAAVPAGRAAVLDLVKRQGPVAADTLAVRLGITAMAVRQHLQGLETDGLVTHRTEPKGRGRPSKLWRVTADADGRFPDGHSALLGDLIGQMRKTFGEDGMDRLIALRTADQKAAYIGALAQHRTLKSRLEALAAIRAAEGYMADVRPDAEKGGWLLVENHCPICAAARLCTGLCREELALFQDVLGKDVRVERVSHILAGAERCAYRIISVA